MLRTSFLEPTETKKAAAKPGVKEVPGHSWSAGKEFRAFEGALSLSLSVCVCVCVCFVPCWWRSLRQT